MIFRRSYLFGSVVVSLLAAATFLPAQAEQVGKKFRLSFAAGVFNGGDSVPSQSANELALVDENFQLVQFFEDPRDDSSVFGSLDIQPTPLATLAGQYAINDIFLIEASVGYQKGDLGDVEMQAQFSNTEVTSEVPFDFRTFRVPVGKITRIPLQLSGVARFRPRARLNPYAGGGLGYSFIGFDASEEFDQLSLLLDQSRGGQTRLASSFPGTPGVTAPNQSEFTDLEGATVDARDTFEWHVLGGAEFSIKRQWSVFGDLRYTRASRQVSVGFNDGVSLGISVPQLQAFEVVGVPRIFGPVQINDGGLVDGGRIVWEPLPASPLGQFCCQPSEDPSCVPNTLLCEPVFQHGAPDGELDPGLYYIQGGGIDYGGLSYQLGVRFTF